MDSDLNSFDKIISITKYIAIGGILLSLFSAIGSTIFTGKQNKLLRIRREQDQKIIAQSNERSESAKMEAASAKKDAAIANEEAAKSNEKASQAELRSKELELELLKLRLAVGDRYLPDNIANALKAELEKYPKKTIEIYCLLAGDTEALNFSKKLDELFKSLEWHSKIIEQNNTMVPAPTGIVVFAKGELNRKIAKFICNQFKSIGYQCYEELKEESQSDIAIQVRAHPRK